jgi:hypothetical protein
MPLLQYNTGLGGAMWAELGTRGATLAGENDPTAVKWPGFTGVANDGNGLPYGQGGTVDASGNAGYASAGGKLLLLEGVLLTVAPALAGTITLFRGDGVTVLAQFAIAAGQLPEWFPLGIEIPEGVGFSMQINQSDIEALVTFRDLTGSRAF